LTPTQEATARRNHSPAAFLDELDASFERRNVGSDEGDVVSDCAHFLLKYRYGAVHQRQSIELSP